MKCPRLHGTLEPVLLNTDFSSPQQAYLCSECHGVWMRALECSAFLGLDTAELLENTKKAGVQLACSHCQTPCKQTVVELDNIKVWFHICPLCQSCFFDSTQFALLFYSQVKIERTISGILGQSPLDNPGLVCCDCQASVPSLDDLYDAGIGYCCKRCHTTPPILSENKIQNVQLVTFRGMEIKIDHWLSTARSRIAVTPVEPSLLDVQLYTLTTRERVCRLGYRKLGLHGYLGRYLEGTERINHITPLHVFLKQRGISWCLEELVALGQFSMTFKPHSIIIEMTADRMGVDTKQKFETIVRRMLIVYEKFVKLTHRYTMPDDD